MTRRRGGFGLRDAIQRDWRVGATAARGADTDEESRPAAEKVV